ncbi:MAG: hypothetical protein WAS21_26700 [Geminicoccaceae bacterium]
MSELENLTLLMLQRIDAKIDRLQSTLDDHTKRLLRLERRHIERDGDALRQDQAMALFDQRLARIERRLELADEWAIDIKGQVDQRTPPNGASQ